jgi:short-subunit dehydrogenase
MKQNGDGSIINYGSTAAVTTNGSGPIYCASKAAVINTVIFWMFAKNFELWWSE